MSTIRKALAAGLAAALAALLSSLATEIPRTQAGWLGLLSASAGVGIAVALGVYRVPNAPASAVARPPVSRSY